MDKLNSLIYLRIISAINPDKKQEGHEVASILIGADVEGTRQKRGNFLDPEYPHFHIILILTKAEYTKHKNEIERLKLEIKNNLASLVNLGNEIICVNKNVNVKQFNLLSEESDFDKMFTYTYKAHTQANQMDIDFPIPCAYPYQLDVDRQAKRGEKFHKKYKRKFKEMTEKLDHIQYQLKKRDFNISAFLATESSVSKLNKPFYSNGFSSHNPHHQAMPG
jgi:hypothetical protein